MATFIVQVTPDGGINGTKIVDADGYEVTDGGAVTFFNEGDAVVTFSTFEVIVDTDKYAAIEAATQAFFAE
jgi:hypothetical protein